MRKLNKIISIVLCATFATGLLSGCGDVDRDKYVARTSSESESESSAEESSSAGESVTSSGEWTNMAFNIDGTDLTLSKMPYSSLESLGWNFDPELYGMSELSAEPGTFYQRSIYLNNANYDDGTIIIGLCNFGTEACGLDSIDLWSVEFLTKDKANYPKVTIAGGITWGTDEAAIKTALGEPSSSTRNDSEAYTELIYNDNAGKTVTLDVYDATGVGRIVLESYV